LGTTKAIQRIGRLLAR